MRSKSFLFAAIGFAVAFFPSCNTSDDDDALANLELEVLYYEGSSEMTLSTLATTLKSNRNIKFTFTNFNDFTDDLTQVEVTLTTGGQTITCDNTDNDGALSGRYSDWPAADSEYTITVYAGGESRSFGHYVITVEPAGSVVHGNVNMGDQGYDNSNGYGPFFQSRKVGLGGWSYANFRSYYVDNQSRLVDFAIRSTNSQLRTVSPNEILANGTWSLLEDECVFQTTKFALYTGGIDPELVDPSEAELLALPAPTLTTVEVNEGTMFVYQTSDGKRGLIKIRDITTTGTGIRFTTHYASIQ